MERGMRTSLLNLDPVVEQAASPLGRAPVNAAASAAPAPAPAPTPPETYQDRAVDFEIVFGRRQVASTGLVLMVVLACVSGVSYLIGKSTAAKASATVGVLNSATVPPAPVTTPAHAQPAQVKTAPALPALDKTTEFSKIQGPLFAEAVVGQVYIQVGAIDKGLAGVWAEGLRTHGLPGFVAPGPSDKIWRVLVGPLPEPKSYEQAKSILDQLGIATFGRKYTEAPAAPSVPTSPQH